MADLIVFIILLAVGFSAGTIAEKTHYRNLNKRESNLVMIPVLNTKSGIDPDKEIDKVYFVSGSCVISHDYFKFILASLKTIFGGRITSYETLVDRGRREAVLRLKEAAVKKGCDEIFNLRIETSSIGNMTGNRAIGCVEVYSYGTAIRYKK